MWSKPAVFTLQLIIGDDGRQVFKPAFHQMERLVRDVIDGAVRTTFDIPRMGTQMMSPGVAGGGTGRTASSCISSMALTDDDVVKASLSSYVS